MPGGLLSASTDRGDINEAEAVKLSFWASSILPISASSKQDLLSMTSTSSRLALTVEMLRNVLGLFV